MNIILKILIGIVGITAGSIGALEAYSHWKIYRFEHDSPIAARLPNDLRQATFEFQRRIHERFPTGTAQNELVDVLASEGFQLERGKSSGMLHLTKMGDLTTICRRDWYVSWRADEKGQPMTVEAAYSATCS